MVKAIFEWLKKDLQVDLHTNSELDDCFSNGQLFGEILCIRGVLPDEEFEHFQNDNKYGSRLHNYLILLPYLRRLGIKLSVGDVRKLLNKSTDGTLNNLIYDVYTALRGYQRESHLLPFEPLSLEFIEELQEAAAADVIHNQMLPVPVIQQRNTASPEILRSPEQKRSVGVLSTRCREARSIHKTILKLHENNYSGSPCSHREYVDHNEEAYNALEDIRVFGQEEPRDLHETKPRVETSEPDVDSNTTPENLLHLDQNRQYIECLKQRTSDHHQMLYQQEKTRKQRFLQLLQRQEEKNQEAAELEMVKEILRQTEVDMKIAAQLYEAKRSKQATACNRIEKYRQMKVRRSAEYEQAQQDRYMQMLERQRTLLLAKEEEEKMLETEKQLEKRRADLRMSQSIVQSAIDMAILTHNFESKTSNKQLPDATSREWKSSFIKGDSLLEKYGHKTINVSVSKSLCPQTLKQKQCFDDYMNVSGRWSKYSEPGEDRYDSAFDMYPDSCKVIGHVVHQLLRQVNPVTVPLQSSPRVHLLAAVIGKLGSWCLSELKKTTSEVHVLDISDLLRDTIDTYRCEMKIDMDNHMLDASGKTSEASLKNDLSSQLSDRCKSKQDTLEERSFQEEVSCVKCFSNFGSDEIRYETGHGYEPSCFLNNVIADNGVTPSYENLSQPDSLLMHEVTCVSAKPDHPERIQSTPDAPFEFSYKACLGRIAEEQMTKLGYINAETVAMILLETLRILPEETICLIKGFPCTVEQALLIEEMLLTRSYFYVDATEKLDAVDESSLNQPSAINKSSVEQNGESTKNNEGEIDNMFSSIETQEQHSKTSNGYLFPSQTELLLHSCLVYDPMSLGHYCKSRGIDVVVDVKDPNHTTHAGRHDQIDSAVIRDDNIDMHDDSSRSSDHETIKQQSGKTLKSFYQARCKYELVDINTGNAQLYDRLADIINYYAVMKHNLMEQSRGTTERIERAAEYPESEPEADQVDEETSGRGTPTKSSVQSKKPNDNKKRKQTKVEEVELVVVPEESVEQIDIPEPPPLPLPGMQGYHYTAIAVSTSVAQCLVSSWEQMERSYLTTIKQCLSCLEHHSSGTADYMYNLEVSFDQVLHKADERQSQLDKYVDEYNSIGDCDRNDEQLKTEWRYRISKLETSFWELNDARRKDLEMIRYQAMTLGWVQDKVMVMANIWVAVMQEELNRFHVTLAVLEDYYLSVQQTSDTVNGGNTASHDSFGNRGAEYLRLRKTSMAPRSFASDISQMQSTGYSHAEVESLTQLEAFFEPGNDCQFEVISNEVKKAGVAIENVINNVRDLMQDTVTYVSDKSEHIMRDFTETRVLSNINGAMKPNPSADNKPTLSLINEIQESTTVAKHRAMAKKVLDEYLTAAGEEKRRCAGRLNLIHRRAVDELKSLRMSSVNLFHQMWSSIEEQHCCSLKAVSGMSQYLLQHVAHEKPITRKLLLNEEGFTVEQSLLHGEISDSAITPIRNTTAAGEFSLEHVRSLWRHFSRVSPTDVISTWAFNLIIQDLVCRGTGLQELPDLWMSLSNDEITALSQRLSSGTEVLPWRSVLYDLAPSWPIPTPRDIRIALTISSVSSRKSGGTVNLEDGVRALHWIRDDDFEKKQDPLSKIFALKQLLVRLVGAPKDTRFPVRKMLLFLCKSYDLFQSFSSAVAVMEKESCLTRTFGSRTTAGLDSDNPKAQLRCASDTAYTSIDLERDLQVTSRSAPQLKVPIVTSLTQISPRCSILSDISMKTSISKRTSVESLRTEDEENMEGFPRPVTEFSSHATVSDRLPECNEHQSLTTSSSDQIPVESRVLREFHLPSDEEDADEIGCNVRSWTHLASVCCAHPDDAPPRLSLQQISECDVCNRTTLNSIRRVLQHTIIVIKPCQEEQLFERIDMDLSLVYQQLRGGALHTVLDALQRDVALPVSLTDVFCHPVVQRYLNGTCILRRFRLSDVIDTIRREK